MTQPFDAYQEAMKMETLAKACLDSGSDRAHPIETAPIIVRTCNAFDAEMTRMWQHPDQMQEVGKELEKITDRWFKTLPDVEIYLDENGRVDQLNFTRSDWDWNGQPKWQALRSSKEQP